MSFPSGVEIVAVLDEATDQYETGGILSVTKQDGVQVLDVKLRDGTIVHIPTDLGDLYILH